MANKKGKLSRSELYYIQENPDNLTDSEIAKELKRPIQIVAQTVIKFKQKKLPKKQKKKVAVEMEVVEDVVDNAQITHDGVVEQAKPTMLYEQFARDKSGKRTYSIMTPAASEQSDALTGKGPGNVNLNKGKRFDQSHIFKPNANKPSR